LAHRNVATAKWASRRTTQSGWTRKHTDDDKRTSLYRVAQKWHTFCMPYNFINYRPISNFFHCQNREKIRNSTITTDPTTP